MTDPAGDEPLDGAVLASFGAEQIIGHAPLEHGDIPGQVFEYAGSRESEEEVDEHDYSERCQ